MPMRTGDADSSNIHSNVPAFLVKLWKLVEDPQYDDHISWNKARVYGTRYFYCFRLCKSRLLLDGFLGVAFLIYIFDIHP